MRIAKRRNRNTSRRIGRKRGGSLKDITMYILCWKSPRTIKNTLESYKQQNLIKHLNVVMYFQERDDKSDAIAAEYGIPVVMGTKDNIGILNAFVDMIKATTTPYFILSECDFQLVENEKSVSDVLNDAMKLIREKNVKLVKLRHRKTQETLSLLCLVSRRTISLRRVTDINWKHFICWILLKQHSRIPLQLWISQSTIEGGTYAISMTTRGRIMYL